MRKAPKRSKPAAHASAPKATPRRPGAPRRLPRPSAASIARSVIQLAHSLGLRVVAEGVEGLDILTYLMKHGCDAIQGYVVSPPLTMPELLTWMTLWSEGAWPGRLSTAENTA